MSIDQLNCDYVARDFKRQLHTARYAYHKQILHKYKVMTVCTPEEGAEAYRLAMENYDKLIEEAVSGHCHEANEAHMLKGFE